MEENIVIPVTPEIQRIVALFEESIGYLTPILQRINENKLGKYESEKEAFNLLVIVLRDIEAFLLLAKKDLSLLPAAEAVARPAFEIATRIVWMLQPNDPFDREARWILHIKAEEDDREKMVKFQKELGVKVEQNNLLSEIRNFREGITDLLKQKGYCPPKQFPNMRDMLNAIGEKK